MQNNVTEITQKLLGALDGNYNVTNMATIIEVITLLEKVAITKEMLETTRLGKHINELRKHIANEPLAKRAKLLVKKWRNSVLVAAPPDPPPPPATPPTNGQLPESRKRPAPPKAMPVEHAKKARVNGVVAPYFPDCDLSDNSNSSFKDVLPIVPINSDSNSSLPDAGDAHSHVHGDDAQPKKRGRKKGSKNHKNLIEEAESSFSNKMAVSRGNAKVKTTQELIESLQHRTVTPTPAITSPAKNNAQELRDRAAKLTERVSLIDQKLNPGSRLKKRHAKDAAGAASAHKRDTSRSRPQSPDADDDDDDDEIVIVDDLPSTTSAASDFAAMAQELQRVMTPSLSVEEALGRLPPVDASVLYAADKERACLCTYDADAGVFRAEDACPARARLEEKYRLKGEDIGDADVALLHGTCVENLNGNRGRTGLVDGLLAGRRQLPESKEDAADVRNGIGLVSVNIVPNFYQLPAKRAACSENYKKYSISERLRDGVDGGADAAIAVEPLPDDKLKLGLGGEVADDAHVKLDGDAVDEVGERGAFREFHECLDLPSYNGDILRILPYVVID